MGKTYFWDITMYCIAQGFAATVEFLLEPKTGNGRLEKLSRDAVANHTTLSRDTVTNHTALSRDAVTNHTTLSRDTVTNHTALSRDALTNHTALSRDAVRIMPYNLVTQ